MQEPPLPCRHSVASLSPPGQGVDEDGRPDRRMPLWIIAGRWSTVARLLIARLLLTRPNLRPSCPLCDCDPSPDSG